VWALPGGIAWETPEVFGVMPLHSGHAQEGVWRRVNEDMFEVTVPSRSGPGYDHKIWVINWHSMQEGRRYEDLMMARKGRTSADLTRERHIHEPGPIKAD
jgi:hypothetical protein